MRRITVVVAVLLVASPLAAVNYVPVETFNATITVNVNMPGTPSGGDVDFTGTVTITSLDFTPGSVTFQGQPVDFDGTEASFLASTYDGSGAVPNLPNNVVPVPGDFGISGALGTMSGTSEWTNLQLGPGFSSSNLDILSFPYDGRDHLLWNSTVVPELDGHLLRIDTENSIQSIDPINGIIQLSTNGTINALDAPAVPAALPWAALLSAGVILLLSAWALHRRHVLHQREA